jgi:hypothetical protein
MILCGLLFVCATSALVKGSETEMIGHQTIISEAVVRPESCEYTILAQICSAKGEDDGACCVLAALNVTSCACLVLAAPKANIDSCARLVLAALKATTSENEENDLGDYTDIDGDSNFNSVGHLLLLHCGSNGTGSWPDDPVLESNSSDASPVPDSDFGAIPLPRLTHREPGQKQK